MNCATFIDMKQLLASYNDKIASVVLQNAALNISYTSSQKRRFFLSFLVRLRKRYVRRFGVVKFCIFVNETRDESKKEQTALILRFVDKDDFIRERFFGFVHVKDTTSLTLRDGIFKALSSSVSYSKYLRSKI